MDPQRRRRRALWRLPYIAKLISRPPRLPRLDELLPQDPRFSIGDLPCGVRYVVYTNRKPRARALLRLVVRVGSLAEEEDQLGIAHLIEHMVFRGTPSFPANDLKRFLERCGLSWGADLNAETGMEHTTYSLDIPLKKNSTELLATGLRVLKEFAFDALLRSEDIQKEKGVVEEEWRGRLGVEQRVEDKFWAEVFAGTLHSQRLPIGKMETLRRCPDERLRAFYKRWYRPQQMTILCIGDFGSNTVAKTLIEKAFADVQPSQDAEQQWTPPPLSARPRASVVYRDQELSSYVVRLRFFFEETTRRTLPEMVGDMSRDLLLMGLNRRLSALQLRPKAPFLSAAANEEHITQTCVCVSISANVLKADVLKAAETLGEVLASLSRHGLSEREMELTRKFHCTALDSVWAERHHVDSEDVLECAEDFVLSGEQTRLCSDCMDVRLQHEALQLLAKGPLADPQLQRVASELFNFAAGRWSIEAEMAGDDSTDLEPEVTPGDLRQAMEQFAARAELPPFAWLPGELLDPNAAQDQMGEPNPIIETHSLSHFAAQHWVTASGSTVTWLRTDFEPDEILIQGLLPCGLSELGSAALRASCASINALRVMDGLGSMTKAQLQEYLADANASVLPGVQVVLPTAPRRPITCYKGEMQHAWHDYITDHEGEREDELSAEDLQQTTERVHKMLDAEAALVGARNVYLGGASQGCGTALHIGLTYPGELGGIVGTMGHLLSCTPISREWLSKKIPVYTFNGLDDELMRWDVWVKATYERLAAAGAEVKMVVDEGVDHGEEEDKWIRRFLTDVLKSTAGKKPKKKAK